MGRLRRRSRKSIARWIVAANAFNFVATAGLFLGFAKVFAKSSLMRRSRG